MGDIHNDRRYGMNNQKRALKARPLYFKAKYISSKKIEFTNNIITNYSTQGVSDLAVNLHYIHKMILVVS